MKNFPASLWDKLQEQKDSLFQQKNIQLQQATGAGAGDDNTAATESSNGAAAKTLSSDERGDAVARIVTVGENTKADSRNAQEEAASTEKNSASSSSEKDSDESSTADDKAEDAGGRAHNNGDDDVGARMQKSDEAKMLRKLAEAVQNLIFLRYQTRSTTKLYTSLLFLVVPIVAAFTPSAKLPGFQNPLEENYFWKYLVPGLSFLLADILEWLVITFGIMYR